MTFTIAAIGHVRGGRIDPIDDDWGNSRTTIELDAGQVGRQALAGLDAFSHAEIISCSTGCRKRTSNAARVIPEAARIGR